MYNVKTELVKDLKGGRTARYIAETLDVTESYISTIFNNKIKCTKIIAMGLISIRYNVAFNSVEMQELIEKHFIKS